ncbi:hypothetical protein P43SY_005563 [Pythium insidiosum]|uniref:ubiquitinyl hydrolase 1 n=1 Tax=Pythium insidiosum TaxID=114742 RepID=A0AAD5LKQ7_PYTIN|nr:hypothetical protein P43SY_005563 [Pythium insidiosum]
MEPSQVAALLTALRCPAYLALDDDRIAAAAHRRTLLLWLHAIYREPSLRLAADESWTRYEPSESELLKWLELLGVAPDDGARRALLQTDGELELSWLWASMALVIETERGSAAVLSDAAMLLSDVAANQQSIFDSSCEILPMSLLVATKDVRVTVPAQLDQDIASLQRNLGNTCFFNAILQALASVDTFRDYLAHVVLDAEQAGAKAASGIRFTSALLDCLTDLAPRPSDRPSSTVVPRRLNEELCSRLASFRGNKQQDAQELLQFLVSLVGYEHKRCTRGDRGIVDLLESNLASEHGKRSPSPTDDAGSDTSASSSLPGSHNGLFHDSPVTSSISDLRFESAMETKRWSPMYGLQVDLLQCSNCGNYRPMVNRRFLDVSLSLQDFASSSSAAAASSISLWDCLRHYTAPQYLSGVECSYCTATRELAMKRRECEQLQRAMEKDPGDIAVELEVHQLKDDIHQLDDLVQNDPSALHQFELRTARCRALCDYTKRMQFSRCPDVLCFHFNRKVFHAWSGNTRKLDTHVTFPIELDMSPFCRYEQPSNRSASTAPGPLQGISQLAPHLLYELTAVILHHGSDRSGHFTAFRRVRRTQQWFFISDATVQEASEEEVLRSCAYMLFYERKIVSRARRHRDEWAMSPSFVSTSSGESLTPLHASDDDDDMDDDAVQSALSQVPDEFPVL